MGIAEPIIARPQENAAFSEAEKTAILDELGKILSSKPFRNSVRSKQFLSYVVQHKLEGREDFLKERTIGTEVFQRKANYATAEDSVVRVQAGEVRRRLEQYNHAEPEASHLRIELPLGSYAPEFHWNQVANVPEAKAPSEARKNSPLRWVVAALCVALVLAVVLGTGFNKPHPRPSALDQFWSPVFATSQPVLICLAKPIFYRPSLEVYRRYSSTHPGTFQTEVERYDQPLPLDPKEKLVWGDLLPYGEYGVAVGDVYVAARLSALFDHIEKPSQVRIGANYSFQDLRNAPAVLVGAYNNRWTMKMTSDLRFAFAEENGNFSIQERGPGGVARSWKWGQQGEAAEDIAIVTRLLDAKTGQVLIAAAGLGAHGTQAAGEFISRNDYLENVFRTAPADWQKKNLQVVLQTTVTDSVAGPPRVVATYFW